MSWHPSVRTRHLLVITLLVLTVAVTLTILNLARLAGSRLAAVRAAEKVTSVQIFALAQQAILRNPQLPPQEAISGDEAVRNLLRAGTEENGDFAYLAIVSTDGATIAQADPRSVRQTPSLIRSFDDLEHARWFGQLRAMRRGEAVYEIVSPISLSGRPFGKILLGVPAGVIFGDAATQLKQLLLITLAVAGLALLLTLLSAGFVLRPLRELMKSIELLEAESAAIAANEPLSSEPAAEPAVTNGIDSNSVTQRLRVLGKRFAGSRLELETMRDQLQQVVGSLSERVVLMDRERRVLMASPEAERLLSGGHFKLRGRPITETLGPQHPLSALTEKAFTSQQSLQETTVVSANGDEAQKVVASVQLFEDHGKPAGALLTLRDFESLRQLETQLDYATKLAALSRITSGVAHEVKNPLHAMVLHLELLNAKLETGLDPKTHVQVLTSEVNRLNRVVQTFLDFTRPVELKLLETDANTLVREVMLLAADARADNIEIIERYAEGPLQIKADADLLKQAILNIVINGCQAMTDGGQLRVSTSRDPKGQVQITVSDQGPGIPENVRDKIFNLYYTTKPQGSGIGLAQAFRAVQLHNGRIEVDSQPGAGARFRITLPAA
ncbi:MAG TPA: ATP-binding protein [Blastocatellia bacterium]|nr:ATP-binding protein [Blastocatellia bacterium]